MSTTKEDPDEPFKGEHQTNQKIFPNVKTSCHQTGFQAPKTSNQYFNNETILTNNSKTNQGSVK
ncbi:MAG: hypothetical protein MUE93_03325 [Ignavibacteriaceae bacterium]|jgi:hypothetical protein|nr:hypothetical protein [Ignavibacteriaceae bacterium]MCU0364685.1 hypothetical protein [Ignavibacteriaceae bacterium]MCU0415173.1 hypothetical protein [Ignavibacteriaceae bacterium]